MAAAEEAEDTLQAEERHNDKKAKTETGSNRTKATATADPQEPLTMSHPKNVVEEGRIYFFYR